MSDNHSTEQITLPDGTEVYVILKDNEIEYVVDDPDADAVEESIYTFGEAYDQAQVIRRREMKSWDTFFPEETGPILDVARALESAATHLEQRQTEDDNE